MSDLAKKIRALKTNLAELDSVLIAYSGGVDSALLLKVAYDVLRQHVLAVTADSPSVPRSELAIAKRIAANIGAEHLVIQTQEFDNPDYLKNPVNRCYFCKSVLYTKLVQVARARRLHVIANGTNVDDLGDYRPGLQAAEEFQIISPLRDAGFTKQDVRELARQLKLEIWDKPATPCLSSRIPYGSNVSPAKLAVIEEAERFLKLLHVRELRVRHFDRTARIETSKQEYDLISANYDRIKQKFDALGFEQIEWREFHSGALNQQVQDNGQK